MRMGYVVIGGILTVIGVGALVLSGGSYAGCGLISGPILIIYGLISKEAGSPVAGSPPMGYAGPGYPQTSYPPTGYPQTSYPPTGYPQTSYPPAAYPPTPSGPGAGSPSCPACAGPLTWRGDLQRWYCPRDNTMV